MEKNFKPFQRMKALKLVGLVMFLVGLFAFSGLLFVGDFQLTSSEVNAILSPKEKANLGEELIALTSNKTYGSAFGLANQLTDLYTATNNNLKTQQNWDGVMWKSAQDFAFPLVKAASKSSVKTSTSIWFLLSIFLAVFGGLLYQLPQKWLDKSLGIKNNGIYFNSATNRGLIGILLGIFLIAFYILLYWFPAYIVNWVILVDPLSMALSSNPASQWFLYGFLYTVVMLVMGVRMFLKYRGNKYQQIRTGSVLFFQTAFAFLIPEILVRLNQPYMDFKNIWPLDYDFFFQWNLDQLIASGGIGVFMLVWGIVLFVVTVPLFTYLYGKRWYCSWVCGCGGLAETLGDPFRQLSSKKLGAWKVERIVVHSVLVFAVVMTLATLYGYFTGNMHVLGVETYQIQKTYGFLIGSAFAGVVGTGFYPLMGNRVWCRFGCPLAAYIGLIQRFKSRFRITTNGGQCISCGNCSTYCEMGIDVRWYAQRGQNIVRSSCVGCGVCSAVCPRGVLKLENGPDKQRINENPILIGGHEAKLNNEVV